jgi:hypothetical protein
MPLLNFLNHMSHLIYAVFPPDRWANLDAITMNEPVPTALLLFFLDCQSSAQHFSNPRTIQRVMFQLHQLQLFQAKTKGGTLKRSISSYKNLETIKV